jgi:hypothetical protein
MRASAILVLACVAGWAAAFPTFYVSSSAGNDSNPGNSTDAPWRTSLRVTAAIAAGELTPSCSVLFNRGDTFEPVDVSGALGVIFQSYGDDALPLPLFSGATVCEQWTPAGDGSWVCGTPLPAQPSQPLAVANGTTALTYARWPDAAFARMAAVGPSGGGNVTFQDPTIPADLLPLLVGATVRMRAASYFYGSGVVVAVAAGGWVTLSALNPGTLTLAVGTGYFIDGSCALLDAANEWCLDTAGTLRMVPSPGWTPVGGQVAVAVQPSGIFSNGTGGGNTFALLAVSGVTEAGISLPGADYTTVVQCTVAWSGGVGVAVQVRSVGGGGGGRNLPRTLAPLLAASRCRAPLRHCLPRRGVECLCATGCDAAVSSASAPLFAMPRCRMPLRHCLRRRGVECLCATVCDAAVSSASAPLFAMSRCRVPLRHCLRCRGVECLCATVCDAAVSSASAPMFAVLRCQAPLCHGR